MPYWMWYPGDMELYHRMKQDFSRVERGVGWPAFWKSDGFRNRVCYAREVNLAKEASFTVHAVRGAYGYVQVGDDKYPLEKELVCGAGPRRVQVHIACIERFPAVYIESEEETLCSGPGWSVRDYLVPPVPAGFTGHFTDRLHASDEWVYEERVYAPVLTEAVAGGTLVRFETELTACLEVKYRDGWRDRKVYLGESRSEVLDAENCYFFDVPDKETGRTGRTALYYAYIPDADPSEVEVRAIHQYIDIPRRMRFSSEDKKLERIMDVAAHTFLLCSGVFFIDGVKRDRWIWGGDAYQSILVNRYLTADREVEQRTLTALRGNDVPVSHVNTITDYSMLWILGVYESCRTYGDTGYLRFIYPKMVSMMRFLLDQRDGDGLFVGRPGDWIYIDWADLDKEGPLCAEQMLLVRCLQVMDLLEKSLGETGDIPYRALADALSEKIDEKFWDPEKRAYIDSFVSGRRHVTKHANILAVLFDIADGDRQREIAESVLKNREVPPITTPYFTFFELDALGKLGFQEEILERFRSYWGGMLDLGAVTFWEEYDPSKPMEEQYGMYGDPYGKSFCHAWSASPIYLFARYFLGIDPGRGGYAGMEEDWRDVSELEQMLKRISMPAFACTVPLGERGSITCRWDGTGFERRSER